MYTVFVNLQIMEELLQFLFADTEQKQEQVQDLEGEDAS